MCLYHYCSYNTIFTAKICYHLEFFSLSIIIISEIPMYVTITLTSIKSDMPEFLASWKLEMSSGF